MFRKEPVTATPRTYSTAPALDLTVELSCGPDTGGLLTHPAFYSSRAFR